MKAEGKMEYKEKRKTVPRTIKQKTFELYLYVLIVLL